MKIVKGKLFSLLIGTYSFPVITSDLSRAAVFYRIVFPDQEIKVSDIVHVETFFYRSTMAERFAEVKQHWKDMDLLQATPGTIKFNKNALDLLLESSEILLTNSR